jgi:hypothetical protein
VRKIQKLMKMLGSARVQIEILKKERQTWMHRQGREKKREVKRDVEGEVQGDRQGMGAPTRLSKRVMLPPEQVAYRMAYSHPSYRQWAMSGVGSYS